MISAILAKLFASTFKAVSYTRFLKLVVIGLDLVFCLFAGFNLISLTLSECRLFEVLPAEQSFFIGCLVIRALIAGFLFLLVFKTPLPVQQELCKFRSGAYLAAILIYILNKYLLTALSPALQTLGLGLGMAGLGYTLVIITITLTGRWALKIISF